MRDRVSDGDLPVGVITSRDRNILRATNRAMCNRACQLQPASSEADVSLHMFMMRRLLHCRLASGWKRFIDHAHGGHYFALHRHCASHRKISVCDPTNTSLLLAIRSSFIFFSPPTTFIKLSLSHRAVQIEGAMEDEPHNAAVCGDSLCLSLVDWVARCDRYQSTTSMR